MRYSRLSECGGGRVSPLLVLRRDPLPTTGQDHIGSHGLSLIIVNKVETE